MASFVQDEYQKTKERNNALKSTSNSIISDLKSAQTSDGVVKVIEAVNNGAYLNKHVIFTHITTPEGDVLASSGFPKSVGRNVMMLTIDGKHVAQNMNELAARGGGISVKSSSQGGYDIMRVSPQITLVDGTELYINVGTRISPKNALTTREEFQPYKKN